MHYQYNVDTYVNGWPALVQPFEETDLSFI